MSDRTIEWADTPAGETANYVTGEGGSDPPDNNFVVAETEAGTKLLEWDATAQAWQVRGDADLNGNDLSNVGDIDTDSASIDSREYLRDVTETITVGSDAASNQDAVDQLHYYEQGTVTIELADEPGTDLYIPPTVGARRGEKANSEGFAVRLDASGGKRLNSLYVDSWTGMGLQLFGGEITGFYAGDNEDAAISVYGSRGRVHLNGGVSLSGDYNKAIMSYSSNVTARDTLDLGNPNNPNVGIEVKHEGHFVHRNGTLTGTISNGPVARTTSGHIYLSDVTATSGTGFADADQGLVIAPERTYGLRGVVNKQTDKTLSGGTLSDPSGYVIIQSESGSADTLEQIDTDPSQDGLEFTLEPAAGETITVAHDAIASPTDGGIYLQGGTDFVMDSPRDKLKLIQEPSGIFSEVSRSDNA